MREKVDHRSRRAEQSKAVYNIYTHTELWHSNCASSASTKPVNPCTWAFSFLSTLDPPTFLHDPSQSYCLHFAAGFRPSFFTFPRSSPPFLSRLSHSWAFNFLITFALLPISHTTHMNCRLHRRRELTIPSSQPLCVVTFVSLDTSLPCTVVYIFIQAAPCSPNKRTYLSKAASWKFTSRILLPTEETGSLFCPHKQKYLAHTLL